MKHTLTICSLAVATVTMLWGQTTPLGLFEERGDVGTVLHPGALQYFPANKAYEITGSGDNMWAAADAFQFVWKKMSGGDVDLSADIAFANSTGDPHKKAVLMIRQSLDADSAYVDVALHNVGLTSLQAREAKGVATHEIQSFVSGPKRVGILKRGDNFYMFVAGDDGQLHMAGGSFKVPLTGTSYVGLGVCAHNKDVSETAAFSNVSLSAPPPAAPGSKPTLYSAIETITVTSTDRRVTYVAPERLEAPNWTPDGESLLFNGNGHIFRVSVDGGKPVTVDTDFANRVNNDHGISPDGTMLAISDQSQDQRRSIVYTVPIGGGTPKRITQSPSASYFHGWSPDGKTLAFVGDRNGNLDVYTIPASGGEETRLTTAEGLDDGPEYSPDGEYIYFNSERTGSMQI